MAHLVPSNGVLHWFCNLTSQDGRSFEFFLSLFQLSFFFFLFLSVVSDGGRHKSIKSSENIWNHPLFLFPFPFFILIASPPLHHVSPFSCGTPLPFLASCSEWRVFSPVSFYSTLKICKLLIPLMFCVVLSTLWEFHTSPRIRNSPILCKVRYSTQSRKQGIWYTKYKEESL